MRRLLAFALVTLGLIPALHAQTPDWTRFQPMQVGNEWQYEHRMTYWTPNGTFNYYWTVTKRVIGTFDSLGVAWYLVRDSTGPGMPAYQPPQTLRVRYDAAQRGVVAPSWGTTSCAVGPCFLDTAIGQGATALAPADYLLGLTSGGKRYTELYGATVDVVDGVGMIRRRTSSASTTLFYARVGTQSYGTSSAVGAELPASVHAMTLHPSVTRTAATLRLTAPSRVEVFDATGRRVYRAEASAGEHRIEVAAWAPGLYVVRADGETRRLVVAR